MNFKRDDIESSQAYLRSLYEKGALNVHPDTLSNFLLFISNNISAASSGETLLNILQRHSADELRSLEKKFFDDVDFARLVSKSFRHEKRNLLKQKLLQTSSENEISDIDELIKKALLIEKRNELRTKLKNRYSQQHTAPVLKLKKFIKPLSIAATIIIMFLLWQPHHSSDAVLFSEYSRNMDNNSVPKIPPSELIQEPSGLRGGEWHFKNYNSHETATLLEAIALVVTHKRYTEAEQIFRRYNIKKEENPELAFYEAVAQLNSTNTKEASTTLEYLNNLNQFRYADEAKFHLAFAHLKSGDRHKAKMVLRQLANSKGKLSEKAEQTLKQIRWF